MKLLPGARPPRRGVTLVEVLVATLLGALVLGGVYLGWSAAGREVARGRTRQTLEAELRRLITVLVADLKSMPAGTLSLAAGAAAAAPRQVTWQVFQSLASGSTREPAAVATVTWEFATPAPDQHHLVRREQVGRDTRAQSFAPCLAVLALCFERSGPADAGRYRWALTATAATCLRLPDGPDDPPGDSRNARIDVEVAGELRVPGSTVLERLSLRSSASCRVASSFVSNY